MCRPLLLFLFHSSSVERGSISRQGREISGSDGYESLKGKTDVILNNTGKSLGLAFEYFLLLNRPQLR